MLANVSAEDRFGIQELIARYIWSIDTSNCESAADCFTADALLVIDGQRHEGRQAIYGFVEGLTGRDSWPGTQHHSGQILIEDGDASRCHVRSYSATLQRQRDGTSSIRTLGVFHDTCVKVDGEWLFAERLWEPWDPDKVKDHGLAGRPLVG